MGQAYERGYTIGTRDAQAHEPAKCTDAHNWFAIGYRDGYTDARRTEEKGR